MNKPCGSHGVAESYQTPDEDFRVLEVERFRPPISTVFYVPGCIVEYAESVKKIVAEQLMKRQNNKTTQRPKMPSKKDVKAQNVISTKSTSLQLSLELKLIEGQYTLSNFSSNSD